MTTGTRKVGLLMLIAGATRMARKMETNPLGKAASGVKKGTQKGHQHHLQGQRPWLKLTMKILVGKVFNNLRKRINHL